MNVLTLAIQAGGEGKVEQLAQTFGVDWPHLSAQIISFAIVCGALYWFAYRPVLQMLEARRVQIAQGLLNTQKIDAALAELETRRQQTLDEARTQASQSIA